MHRYKASVEQSFRLHVAERRSAEGESPSVDPASCRLQPPPPPTHSSQEASKNPERVELRGIPGKNVCAAMERPLGSQAPPSFSSPESSAGWSNNPPGWVGRFTDGIWRAWIRFCSWLQQWDDSSDGWSVHTCVSKAKRGAHVDSLSLFGKEKNITERERNGGMRKQSSKRQQNDWACHIFLFCFVFIYI